MIMKTRHLLAAAALSTLAGLAQAGGPLTLVNGTASFGGAFAASASPITDSWSFSVTEASNANASAISIQLGTLDWDFTSITLSGPSGPFGFVQDAASTDALEIWKLNPVVLQSGNYTLDVVGNVPSPALAGSYGGNLNISPVPEPASAGMLLSGLGLLGLRRRSTQGKRDQD